MAPGDPAPTRNEHALPEAGGTDFLVRSEEQLRVATERVASGRARLEKFVVTETRTFTVEVSHEEVRLVMLDADAAPGSAAASADPDRWMVLGREEVVVTKRIVPVERVRLEVVPVVEQRQVSESVRSERIDVDVPSTSWDNEEDSRR